MRWSALVSSIVALGCGAPIELEGPWGTVVKDGSGARADGKADSGASIPDGSVPIDGGSGGGGGSGDGGSTLPDAGQDAGNGAELNPGWIGGRCSSPSDCNSPDFSAAPLCETFGFPNGMCTQACTLSSTSGLYVCPDTQYGPGTLNTVTRCINANGQPRCASECDFTKSATGCRPGYTCVLRQRYNQPDRIFKVCLPSSGQRWPGEPAPANDIGAACNADRSCASLSCLSINGGYCSKTMCDLAGCPPGSTCFKVGTGNETFCLKDCASSTSCRQSEGYVCHASYKICWPGVSSAPHDPSVGAADCASAWGTNGSGLSGCDSVKDDYVVVRKSARNLALCNRGTLVSSFRVGLGFAPVGDKEREGDGRTPEGVFYVAQLVPSSKYYKAFLISYPDKDDAVRGLNANLISQSEKNAIDSAQNACTTPPQTTGLGGYIEIHGEGSSHDWTWGCVALDNPNVDTLYATIGVRDTVVILP